MAQAKQGAGGRLAAVAIIVVLALVMFGKPSAEDQAKSAAEAEDASPMLAPATVEKCRAMIATGIKGGIIRDRPSANRIDVDEAIWARMEAKLKDATLTAVSCDLWQRRVPPSGQHVVAYGVHTGKRIQMLTEVGMLRE